MANPFKKIHHRNPVAKYIHQENPQQNYHPQEYDALFNLKGAHRLISVIADKHFNFLS
jgi:hypothetical protein